MANKKYVSLSKLSTFLDNLKNTFASLAHTHKLSDITDYTVDSTLSSTSTNPVQNKIINAEFDAVSQAMGALDLAIDGKANTEHNHAISDVTDLQTALDTLEETIDGKANASHEHSASKITSGILAVERGGTGNMYGYVRAGAQEGSAIGSLATAEGRETIASGYCSHAEGNYTEASGSSSHSEGQNTEASGNFSHAEGENSSATGYASHAEGDHTIASGESSHVQGRYNTEDTAGVYAHIVGNGESNSTRSNAHTVDWDGNGWFAGDVYVGGTSQDDVLASKLISQSDQHWNLLYDSGEISAIANSISNIDVSGYTNIQVLVRLYNDGDSIGSRAGSAIFTCANGKTYQFPVWSSMFSKSINTVYTMATFNLVDGWLVCPYASRLIGDASTFEDEGGTAGNLALTGSGMMKCTSQLSTLTISSLDQNSSYYFGMGSRVMVWGWNA